MTANTITPDNSTVAPRSVGMGETVPPARPAKNLNGHGSSSFRGSPADLIALCPALARGVNGHVARGPAKFVVAESGCWLWTGGKSNGGYGRCYKNGRLQQAHRVSYEAVNGPVPAGLDLDHICRTPACVNPRHLEAVTTAENSRRRHDAKLDMKKTRLMRAMRARGESYASIGRAFGVSDVLAGHVCKGNRWREEAA